MKRLAIVTCGFLLLALSACGGGGGGDAEAFCEELENLSAQVEDGDLGDDGGLEDALETAVALEEAANDDQQDAVSTVADELEDADPDDEEETAEVIQDELGDFAEDCDIDEDEFAIVETTTTTTSTTTTSTTTTTTGDDGDDDPFLDQTVGARQPVPADLEAGFEALADACFNADMASCDELFNTTPANSVAEEYGDTCAGRIDDGFRFDGECVDIITGPVDPATTAEIVELTPDPAQGGAVDACFNGDMAACDSLFDNNAQGSFERFYGGNCGARALTAAANCVDIFGPQAFI